MGWLAVPGAAVGAAVGRAAVGAVGAAVVRAVGAVGSGRASSKARSRRGVNARPG